MPVDANAYIAWGPAKRRAFQEKLRELVQEAGSDRAFAKRLGSVTRAPLVGQWLRHKKPRKEPRLDSLYRIAIANDVSIDWLLGFDVPRRRSERQRIGVLSAEFSAKLEESRPVSATGIEIPKSGAAQQAIDDWWSARLRETCSAWTAPFEKLVGAMLAIDKTILGSDHALWQLDHATAAVKQALAMLGSSLVTWQDLHWLTAPIPLLRDTSTNLEGLFGKPKRQLATPFPVAGGYGFAWQRDGEDFAVYVDAKRRSFVRRTREQFLQAPPRASRGLLDWEPPAE